MIRGLYTAAAGLATATLRLGVVSNNIANANTPGYKQDRLPDEVGKSLDLLRWAVDDNGNPVGTITLGPNSGVSELDLAPGPIQETGNPLDLAIAGTGFFTVRDADGLTKYTRDGGFHLDADGTLRARDGSSVLNQTGQPVQLAPGSIVEVAADGTLLANGVAQDRLLLVDFGPGQQLIKQGNGMFSPPNGELPQPTTGAQLYQGFLEGSNVDMTESMVQTMQLVRAYEANQRLMQVQDETLNRAVNEIGKVA
ncbi:MAG TPA: flagellar hook-basal body protein [Chloroflexota bacterium]|nr:flagellar hook-basal body protein [Chloroflexota bacterium]